MRFITISFLLFPRSQSLQMHFKREKASGRKLSPEAGIRGKLQMGLLIVQLKEFRRYALLLDGNSACHTIFRSG
jgi:hypothetical protein